MHCVMSSLPQGPFLGRWNVLLEYRFPLKATQTSRKVSLKALSKRVACDQLVMYVLLLILTTGDI